MAKDSRDSRLRDGERRLEEWQAGSTPEELRAHIGRDAAADLAIAARLGGIADDVSVALLQELGNSTDKLVQKEIKRSLYRLEQKGVAIPKEVPPAPVRLAASAPVLEGYLSAVDNNGDQLVWVVRGDASGVLHLFAVVNELGGLKDLGLFETSRKSLRAARADMAEQHGIHMHEADWRYCDYSIDRAFRRSRERGDTSHGDLPGMRRRLTDAPVTPSAAPIRSLLDIEEVRADSAARERSAQLMREPEVRQWLLPYDTIAPYLDEWKAILDSPIVLSEEQQRERLESLSDKLVREVFSGEERGAWVWRLETLAYVLHATKRVDEARAALAAALALETSDQGGLGVPICDAIGRTCLAAYVHYFAEQAKQQAQAEAEAEAAVAAASDRTE